MLNGTAFASSLTIRTALFEAPRLVLSLAFRAER
jgi:hypothetical protein